MSERGERIEKGQPKENLFQDELFISLLFPLAPGDRICYGNITEVIFEPTAVDLICLALRGGQTSVVDEGKGKISKSGSLSVLCSHVSVQQQQKRYLTGVVVNIFP